MRSLSIIHVPGRNDERQALVAIAFVTNACAFQLSCLVRLELSSFLPKLFSTSLDVFARLCLLRDSHTTTNARGVLSSDEFACCAVTLLIMGSRWRARPQPSRCFRASASATDGIPRCYTAH